MRRFHVAVRVEVLHFVALGVYADRDDYERVPIVPVAVVCLMILSVDDSHLPAATQSVTLHGARSWLQRARDVPNDMPVVKTLPILEAPVPFDSNVQERNRHLSVHRTLVVGRIDRGGRSGACLSHA